MASLDFDLASNASLNFIHVVFWVLILIDTTQALIVLAFWAAVMPALMKPDNALATGVGGGIVNANLYFFSWFGLAGSLLVFAHFLRTAYNVGVGTKNESFRGLAWAGLVLTSFVVFVTASRVCQATGCSGRDTSYDRRTKFAIAVGVVSAFISLIWMFVGALGKFLAKFLRV